jgi:hypothetical protein
MRIPILGLAGQQGAGKDWVYKHLRDMMGKLRVRRMAFADGVRREVTLEVMDAIGVKVGETDGAGQWQKPYSAGQRWLLQQWGTEFRRAQDPDYWVKYGLAYIEERYQPGDLWVVTDVRFKNEAQAIHDAGGKTALVSANPSERARRLGISMPELKVRSEHPSERIDFGTTYIIHNHGGNVIMDLPERLLDWLGLPVTCYLCRTGEQHVWHNDGTATGLEVGSAPAH